jgi:AcrR family transcriptional regulator
VVRGRSNAELSEASREALLAGAREAFSRHGYAGAPLEELVREAGLTKGALYHHFGSKQGLFVAVVKAIDAEILARVRAEVPERPATRAGFLRACRLYLEAMLEPGMRRILLIDCPAVLGYSAMRELEIESSIRPIAEMLDALVESGEFPPLDTEATAHLINGALYDAALWMGDSPRPRQALDRAMQAFETLLVGLAAQARRGSRRTR